MFKVTKYDIVDGVVFKEKYGEYEFFEEALFQAKRLNNWQKNEGEEAWYEIERE